MQQQIETRVIHVDYLRNGENLRSLVEEGWVYGDRGAANPDLQIWLRQAPAPQTVLTTGGDGEVQR